MAEEWDLFIAHAGSVVPSVEELYKKLVSRCRVFLDSECLLPGDDWDSKLAEAQRSARISVIIVSHDTPESYYQREEIAAALAMARASQDSHRVVPVYLEDVSDGYNLLPYGLRIKHGIYFSKEGSIEGVANALLKLLEKTNGDFCFADLARESNSKRSVKGKFSNYLKDKKAFVIVLGGILIIFCGAWLTKFYLNRVVLTAGSYSCNVDGRVMHECKIFLVEKNTLKLRFATPEHGEGGLQDNFQGAMRQQDGCYLIHLKNTFYLRPSEREKLESSRLLLCPREGKGWSGTWKSEGGLEKQFNLKKVSHETRDGT